MSQRSLQPQEEDAGEGLNARQEGEETSVSGASAVSEQGSPSMAMERVVSALSRIRSAARAQLIAQRAGMIAAGVLGAVVVLGVLDYFLRFPAALRAGHLVAGLIAIGVLAYRRLWPMTKFSPTLTDVALRLEQSEAARAIGLTNVLASGVEFARLADAQQEKAGSTPGGMPGFEQLSLRREVEQTAATAYAAFAAKASIFDRRPLMRSLGMVAAACVPLGALWALTPHLTGIGASRTLTPWRDAQWPKRTEVLAAGAPEAFADGVAIPLQAILVRSDVQDQATQVMLNFRVDGGETRKALMTYQGRRANATNLAGELQEGAVFERLLDPEALMSGRSDRTAESTRKLEYWFETRDDQTPVRSALIVEPPAIVAARATVTPPAYMGPVIAARMAGSTQAGGTSGEGNEFLGGARDASPMGPSRGVIGPVLANSRIELDIQLNKVLPGLTENASEEERRAFISRTFAGLEDVENVTLIANGEMWKLGMTATKYVRFPVSLRDEHGILSIDDASFRVDVTEDRPPTAAVIDPIQDEWVLPSAVLDVTGEGRDDVAVASVELRLEHLRPPGESAGAAPESLGEPQTVASWPVDQQEGTGERVFSQSASATYQLSLESLKAQSGDEVVLVARVKDLLLSSQGGTGVDSLKRRLRVISEADLVEQIQAELGSVREAAKRSEQEQARTTKRLSEQAAKEAAGAESAPQKDDAKAQGLSEVARGQESVSERIAPMSETISRLMKRSERNKLDNDALAGVLKDAKELADEALKASEQASDAIDRLNAARANAQAQAEKSQSGQQSGQQNGQQGAENAAKEAAQKAAQQANQAQREVEERLAELANMLDRGQDDWAVRRGIERLLSLQQELGARTGVQQEQTQGLSPAQMDTRQREELSKLAKEQAEAAQKTQALLDTLAQRAQQMESTSQTQAKSMQAAAAKARQEQLQERQRQAAENIRQNKTEEAQRQQQQASKTLEEMLEELDRGQQRRDESLRRLLATSMEAVEKLIKQQEGEVARLAAVMNGEAVSPALDAGMILMHQNTKGTTQSIKTETKDAARVVEALESAGEAQVGAITALRMTPPDHPEADANERVSLTRLQTALEELAKLDEEVEEREEDRKRRELKKLYGEVLELQMALNAETSPLIGAEVDRRARQTIRTLATRQEDLREKMSQIRSQAAEMADAKVFDFAHTRYDAAAGEAIKPLSEGSASPRAGRSQAAAARIVAGLVEALDEAQKQKDEFKEEEGGDDAGGGAGGAAQKPPLIPPIAELKLLRAMQAEALDRTKLLEGAVDAEAKAELEAVSGLQSRLAQEANALLEKIKQEAQGGDEKPADIKERK